MSDPCVRTRIANDSDFPTSFVRAAFNLIMPAGVTKIDVVFLEPVATGTGESSGECWLNGVERNNFQRLIIYVAVSGLTRTSPSRTSHQPGKRQKLGAGPSVSSRFDVVLRRMRLVVEPTSSIGGFETTSPECPSTYEACETQTREDRGTSQT